MSTDIRDELIKRWNKSVLGKGISHDSKNILANIAFDVFTEVVLINQLACPPQAKSTARQQAVWMQSQSMWAEKSFNAEGKRV